MDRRGVTLIELLVAVTILGVSLAGLIALWSFSFNVTTHSEDIGVGYSIARQEIERVRNMGVTVLPGQQWTREYGYDTGTGSWVPDAPNPHYTATTRMDPYVTDLDEIKNAVLPLRIVRVEVQAHDRSEVMFLTESHVILGGL